MPTAFHNCYVQLRDKFNLGSLWNILLMLPSKADPLQNETVVKLNRIFNEDAQQIKSFSHIPY